MTKGRKDILFIVLLAVSLLLGVVGFIIPPTGQIDGSVLEFIGMLTLLYAVKQIPEAILAGKEIRLKHGETSLAIGDGKDIAELERAEEGKE